MFAINTHMYIYILVHIFYRNDIFMYLAKSKQVKSLVVV